MKEATKDAIKTGLIIGIPCSWICWMGVLPMMLHNINSSSSSHRGPSPFVGRWIFDPKASTTQDGKPLSSKLATSVLEFSSNYRVTLTQEGAKYGGTFERWGDDIEISIDRGSDGWFAIGGGNITMVMQDEKRLIWRVEGLGRTSRFVRKPFSPDNPPAALSRSIRGVVVVLLRRRCDRTRWQEPAKGPRGNTLN